jgi:hypothetical protein
MMPVVAQRILPLLADSVQLTTHPTLFTMTDMQLFSHFILHAYPDIPVASERVWIHEIAAYAHQVRQFNPRQLSLPRLS